MICNAHKIFPSPIPSGHSYVSRYVSVCGSDRQTASRVITKPPFNSKDKNAGTCVSMSETADFQSQVWTDRLS